MASTSSVIGGDPALVLVDPANDDARGVDGVADRSGEALAARGDPHNRSPSHGFDAGWQADEDAIDAEDVLAQADEANALDPVG